MAAWREVVYNVHNNLISLIVKEDDAVVDLLSPAVTRMVIRLFSVRSRSNSGGTTLDSDVIGEGLGNPFDWATNGAAGIVDLMLGDEGVAAGDYRAFLVIYDANHTDGQVWPEFSMRFVNVMT